MFNEKEKCLLSSKQNKIKNDRFFFFSVRGMPVRQRFSSLRFDAVSRIGPTSGWLCLLLYMTDRIPSCAGWLLPSQAPVKSWSPACDAVLRSGGNCRMQGLIGGRSLGIRFWIPSLWFLCTTLCFLATEDEQVCATIALSPRWSSPQSQRQWHQ